MHKNKKILYIILLYTICLMIVSCNKSMKKNQNQNSQDRGKKEVAKTLSQMEEDTEKLIQELWSKKESSDSGLGAAKDAENKDAKEQEKNNKEEQEDQTKEQDKTSEKESSDKESSDKESSSKEGDSKEGEDKQSDNNEKQQDKHENEQADAKPKSWDELKKSVEKLHVDWNSYEPQARKDGASIEMIDGFKIQLNTLSEIVETENTDMVLKETNNLYAHYPQFFNLYKHYAPPEIKKLKFLTRQIILDSQDPNWHNVDKLSTEIKTTWLTAKSRMENADMALNEKIDCAIDDLIVVAQEKKSSLVRLKGDILLQNLKQVK